VREALTNVRRHSVLDLWSRWICGAAFLIEVSDEGRGFAKSAAGLRAGSMRERAAGIGGRLEVVSTKARDTVFLFGRTSASTRSQPNARRFIWMSETSSRRR